MHITETRWSNEEPFCKGMTENLKLVLLHQVRLSLIPEGHQNAFRFKKHSWLYRIVMKECLGLRKCKWKNAYDLSRFHARGHQGRWKTPR
jgi:hypothetical protein